MRVRIGTPTTTGILTLTEQRVERIEMNGAVLVKRSVSYPVLSTARRLALADTLRAAASRIVGGADPGDELATLRAAITAWEMGT